MTKTVLNILATAATDQIRTENYNDQEYLVVPVVALVEGVLQGANSASPELALASEFGRFPPSWDGRPIVMNHPKVGDDFVSANSPQILEQWSYGFTANSMMEDSKLKVEAWLDLTKINTQAEAGVDQAVEMLSTVERINSGQVVEVSTGLFSTIEERDGVFANNAFSGIWRSVAPDHLAFLSEGTLGACSVEDGCGVPRLNMRVFVSKEQEPKANCGCTHESQGDTAMPNSNTESSQNQNTKLLNRVNSLFPEAFKVNGFPDDMAVDDVKKMLTNAFAQKNIDIYHIYTCTQNHVVYEKWDSYQLYQRKYDINTNNVVTLGEDETPVVLATKIIEPIINAEYEDQPTTSSEEEETPDEEENTMSDQDTTNNSTTSDNTTEEEEENVTPNANETSTGLVQPGTIQAQALNTEPLTINQYLDQAPPEVRQVLESGLRMHQQRTDALVAQITANSANEFTEDELRAMDMKTLERTSKLAGSNVPAPAANNYVGQSAPRTHTQRPASNFAPKPLEAFPKQGSTTPAA